jgi:hypothetical protein
MTPPEHFREAERLLALVDGEDFDPVHEATTLARAQVHATLATALDTYNAIAFQAELEARRPAFRPSRRL